MIKIYDRYLAITYYFLENKNPNDESMTYIDEKAISTQSNQ